MRKLIFLTLFALAACDAGPRNAKGDLLSGRLPYKDSVDFHSVAVHALELCQPQTALPPPGVSIISITDDGNTEFLQNKPGTLIFTCRDCPQGRVGHAIDSECPARK